MSAKECEDSQKSNASGWLFIKDQLFASSSTSASSSSYGATGTASSATPTHSNTGGAVSSCDSSSLECMSSNDDPPLGALHSAASPCTLQPPLKLHDHPDARLSPPARHQHCIQLSSSPPPPLTHPRKVEHHLGSNVTRRMGLMKLRRQGSHPPALATKSCHGSFNQAAAARELMVSLERLSMKEKGTGADRREVEARRALLAGEGEGEVEESLNAGPARRRNGLKLAPELPLTAKIAAAMDAEGRIGVQKEITLQCSRNYKSRALQCNVSEQCSPASAESHPAGGAAGSDHGVHPIGLPKMPGKRRRRWIISRRVRSSRSLLGKFWTKLKTIFSSSSRKHLQHRLSKVNY